jgi:uncharacterized protein (TIGR02246 family)
MVTREQIADWVEDYRQAWETKDPDAAAALFTENGSYRDNIFEEPHLGREGVAGYWAEVTAAQSDPTVRMGVPFIDGDRVAVEFWTTMLVVGEELTLPGCLLLRFDDEGLCSDLREYWMTAPEIIEPFHGWGG